MKRLSKKLHAPQQECKSLMSPERRRQYQVTDELASLQNSERIAAALKLVEGAAMLPMADDGFAEIVKRAFRGEHLKSLNVHK